MKYFIMTSSSFSIQYQWETHRTLILDLVVQPDSGAFGIAVIVLLSLCCVGLMDRSLYSVHPAFHFQGTNTCDTAHAAFSHSVQNMCHSFHRNSAKSFRFMHMCQSSAVICQCFLAVCWKQRFKFSGRNWQFNWQVACWGRFWGNGLIF